ncbi:hypothetical protein E0L36_11225 [Streptomyces sp. AJS327]|uniref:hypothetical protein n=1 Tax=Streptomyces sp. AJS327 TaxID=2545265 RepID=UPI0015E047F6|nr:hypothetical protein [Streptomyces sp. AJS327]MBA0051442.1 hypothetical protein [Streptomyces sp. AJS327]
MVWETLGSALVGLAIAYAAARRFPGRLGDQRLVLATGPVAGLLGGLICRVVLGPGHLPVALLAAVGVAAAMVSLLFGDDSRPGAVRRPGPARPSASYGPR